MKIAVIPARGGSKRIPRKNIKEFCGKPMIAYAIEAARLSNLFEHIVVSTDDLEIAQVAQNYGAEVPFIRPAELADDYTGTTEVIAHATQWMLAQNWPVTFVCCIYSTVPFICVNDLKRGFELLKSGNWEYTLSVTSFSAPIFRSFQERFDGGIEMFFPDFFSTRSQDLPIALHDAGQFYWGRPSTWLANKQIFNHYSAPVFIPRWRVQDIDNEEDWIRAEMIAPMIFGRL